MLREAWRRTNVKAAAWWCGAVMVGLVAGCKSGDVDPSTPIRDAQGRKTGMARYHEPYQGIDFEYPANWRSEPKEHVPIDFVGANGCEFSLIGMEPLDGTRAEKNLAGIREQMQEDTPGANFGARPAWAGAQRPDGSFQRISKGRWTRTTVEWDTTFQQGKTVDTVTETMRQGDTDCVAKLQGIEKTFRLYPPTPSPAVGS